ncbi:MAG: hypothetical protein J7L98_04690 [Candidatus Verstraetearchaeota archaeon]|nr:hypothetical protein [Candidatus Verstraetearchaeota archaeon]
MMDYASICILVPSFAKSSFESWVASALVAPLIANTAYKFVKKIKSHGATEEDLLKLLALMVLGKGTLYLSGGSGRYAVRFYGKQYVLHELFCQLVREINGIRARPLYLAGRDTFITQVYSKKLVQMLLELSPTFSTRNDEPPYPTIRYLYSLNGELLRDAVRLLFSVNGTVRPVFEKVGRFFYLRPQLGLGYLSPVSLLEEYQQLLRNFEMNMTIALDSRYPGRGFLVSNSWYTLEKFVELGGFLDGVKVVKGDFKGLDKNSLAKLLLHMYRKGQTRFSSADEKRKLVEKLSHASYIFKLSALRKLL